MLAIRAQRCQFASHPNTPPSQLPNWQHNARYPCTTLPIRQSPQHTTQPAPELAAQCSLSVHNAANSPVTPTHHPASSRTGSTMLAIRAQRCQFASHPNTPPSQLPNWQHNARYPCTTLPIRQSPQHTTQPAPELAAQCSLSVHNAANSPVTPTHHPASSRTGSTMLAIRAQRCQFASHPNTPPSQLPNWQHNARYPCTTLPIRQSPQHTTQPAPELAAQCSLSVHNAANSPVTPTHHPASSRTGSTMLAIRAQRCQFQKQPVRACELAVRLLALLIAPSPRCQPETPVRSRHV